MNHNQIYYRLRSTLLERIQWSMPAVWINRMSVSTAQNSKSTAVLSVVGINKPSFLDKRFDSIISFRVAPHEFECRQYKHCTLQVPHICKKGEDCEKMQIMWWQTCWTSPCTTRCWYKVKIQYNP